MRPWGEERPTRDYRQALYLRLCEKCLVDAHALLAKENELGVLARGGGNTLLAFFARWKSPAPLTGCTNEGAGMGWALPSTVTAHHPAWDGAPPHLGQRSTACGTAPHRIWGGPTPPLGRPHTRRGDARTPCSPSRRFSPTASKQYRLPADSHLHHNCLQLMDGLWPALVETLVRSPRCWATFVLRPAIRALWDTFCVARCFLVWQSGANDV